MYKTVFLSNVSKPLATDGHEYAVHEDIIIIIIVIKLNFIE